MKIHNFTGKEEEDKKVLELIREKVSTLSSSKQTKPVEDIPETKDDEGLPVKSEDPIVTIEDTAVTDENPAAGPKVEELKVELKKEEPAQQVK
mmetsp:Transcript_33598/g.51722  ORF Transcript_33598/g.51722 Transcript_33598/m.51722 type:complete len:93 (+) Transcript_33598:3441-3719(+)